MASEQPEPFHVPFDLRRWAQDAFGVEHALSPTQSAIGGAVLDSIWSLGIAEGLRQATEGWERQWSAEVAGVGAASDEWAQDEDEQAIRDWALDRPGSVVRSRLVGPWEPAEQPEPAHESFTKMPCTHVEGPHPKHTWSHKDEPCEGHVCPGAPIAWPSEQPEPPRAWAPGQSPAEKLASLHRQPHGSRCTCRECDERDEAEGGKR